MDADIVECQLVSEGAMGVLNHQPRASIGSFGSRPRPLQGASSRPGFRSCNPGRCGGHSAVMQAFSTVRVPISHGCGVSGSQPSSGAVSLASAQPDSRRMTVVARNPALEHSVH
jgi:hypothetical protein